MKPVQFILLPLLVLLLIVFTKRLRKQVLLKGVFICIILALMVLTVFPDVTTTLANWVGVGRGVDLVFYFGMLGLSVSCLFLYLRSVRLEEQLTELARTIALQEADSPSEKPT
ncbi:MAG: DUF2304 domain-containing protein [Bacteroidota bacterium]